MGLTLNRLYKFDSAQRKVGVVIIGGTGTTMYGSNETPAAFANMADLAGGALAAASYTVIDVLPQFILFDGDATSIQLVGAGKPEDTGTDIAS